MVGRRQASASLVSFLSRLTDDRLVDVTLGWVFSHVIARRPLTAIRPSIAELADVAERERTIP